MTVGAPQTVQGRQAAAYLTWVDAAGAVEQLVFDVVESEDWECNATVTEHPVEDGPNIADNVRDELSKCTLKVFATNEPIGSSQWVNAAPTAIALSLPKVTPRQLGAGGAVTASVADTAPLQVPEWQSNLQLRAVAGAAAGLVGGAVGGATGAAVGALGGSAAAGLLLNGKVVYQPFQPQAGLPATVDPGTVTATVVGFDDTGDWVAETVQLLLTLKSTAQLLSVIGTKQFVDNMVIDGLTIHRDADTGTGASITIHFTEVRIASTSTVPAPAPTLPRATTPASTGNQNTNDAPPQMQSVLSTLIGGGG